jgi:hypothetical protein
MKKIIVIFLIIGIIAVGAYLYVRHSLSTPGFDPPPPKDTTVQTKPAQSFLDLKPKLIEKLQQLVKQGSNGLYNLFIHEMKPDILKSTIGISKAELVPDTLAMKQLDQSGKLPEEIFKIKTDSILIDGLGLKDILSKDVIDVKTIHIIQPTIDVYSNKRSNNKKADSKTLYQQLMNQMKHIGIGKIVIEKGTLICHQSDNNKSTKFHDIAIDLSNVIIDSTTQYDRNRFLFAKNAELTMKDYAVPTSNNLYTFKVGIISIEATKQLLVAKNILLQPHYNKDEFQNHIKTQLERYEISIPSIEFKQTNWWNLINHEVLQAKLAQINKADIHIYLDRRKPSGPPEVGNFPDQLIMKAPLKIQIEKLNVNDLNLTYEEFSKLSNKTGRFYADNLHGTIYNVTNIPKVIEHNQYTTVVSSGILMHAAPASLTLRFDLSKYKDGIFSAELKTEKGFNGTAFNPVSEPVGLFMVKKGELKQLIAHIRGDNNKASGDVLMLYNDLHVTPLKKDENKPTGLKKKSVTSLIANTFVLKDENPSKNGDVRKIDDASFTRKSGTFFNLLWKTVFVGILKTIGAPERLAYQ